MYHFDNLNQTLIGMSKEILEKGVWRETRGFRCLEMPHPVLICITNPTDRYINIPERKWPKYLGWVESLWLASGTNHMDLVGPYAKNMYNFSDNGETMRAAYGPRIRAFSGIATDYSVYNPNERNIVSGFVKTVDQLRFVIESLQRDINSRQAEITIHDPCKDDFDESGKLKVTKDTPCCRTLNFMVRDGKLDVTLDIRSNDLIWGLSAVNVFNFTLMQEYVANILGLRVGNYYHFVKNLHVYEDKIDLIKTLAEKDPEDYKSEFGKWEYIEISKIDSLKDFDKMVNSLFDYEETLRNGTLISPPFFNSLFSDWASLLFNYWNKNSNAKYTFQNPYLNKLFGVENKSLYDYSQVNKE